MTLTQEYERNQESEVYRFLQTVNEYLQLNRKMSQVRTYAEENPLLTLFLVVSMAMCSIPVMCFCTFVCATVVLTIAGFVLIEGTLIGVATVLLGGALLMASLLALGFGLTIVVGYYTFTFSLEMVKSVSEQLKQRQERAAVPDTST